MPKPNLLPYYQVKLTLLKCKLSFLEDPPSNRGRAIRLRYHSSSISVAKHKKIPRTYSEDIFLLFTLHFSLISLNEEFFLASNSE